MEEQEPKKKNDYKIIIIMIVLFTIIISIQKTYYGSAALERRMLKSVNEINLSCPVMVDENMNIRLDSVSVGEYKEIIYNCTLIDMIKDSMNIQVFEDYISPVITDNIASNPEYRIYKDNNVTISHYYKDRNGESILGFLTPPEAYKLDTRTENQESR